ncbi:hypothetical protein M2277_003833 [Paenibacillus sp. LBL]|jgi:hypothetical protein|nr:hypothetical protein [Paenibacillus sp. LBL]
MTECQGELTIELYRDAELPLGEFSFFGVKRYNGMGLAY